MMKGLAMTCMTSSKYAFLYPSDWLSHSYYNDKNKRSLSTGEMIAKLLKDEKLDRDSLGLSRFQPTLESDPLVKNGAAEHLLQEYVYAWDKTRGPSPDIPGAMEDLAWLTTLLVGAVAKFEKRWRHDFFLWVSFSSHHRNLGPNSDCLIMLQRSRPHLIPLPRKHFGDASASQ